MPFVVIIKIEKFDENDKQEQYIHFIIIRGNILQVERVEEKSRGKIRAMSKISARIIR